jgi:hypothetical protein
MLRSVHKDGLDYHRRGVPFRRFGLGKARNRSSITMTTCRSCQKANKRPFAGYQAFVDQCTRNFKELRLSPKFLDGSHLYKVAMTVAQNRMNIMYDTGGISCPGRIGGRDTRPIALKFSATNDDRFLAAALLGILHPSSAARQRTAGYTSATFLSRDALPTYITASTSWRVPSPAEATTHA